jgi:pyrroline-5-carboxylate reductase
MADLGKIQKIVGFVGAGNMAAALVRGLVGAGFSPKQIVLFDLDERKSSALSADVGATALDSASEVARRADIVILAVKPHAVLKVLAELQAHSTKCLWISIAAGVSLGAMEGALSPGAAVLRAMPNTPALVGKGATGLSAGQHVGPAEVELAQSLLSAVGICEVVAESLMDAVTGVSGSGPAYVMLVIEAMADGGVRAGLPRNVALKLAAQTVFGSAALLLETGKHPGELKDMVTSPGGTTIAGVAALEAAGLRSALIDAVTAATARSRDLSK